MKTIPVCEPLLAGNELRYATDCIKTGWISGKGEYVGRFEQGFAKYCNAKYGISTTNGTTALHLAMLACRIRPGDEIIVPDFTMVAPANSVVYAGGKPVWVDAEHDTWNIDTDKIEGKITKKTRAIMVVHIYGHPVDMDPVLEIARKRGLLVIEDAAEAHGAEYKGKKVGCIGDIGCFSFYSNKIITTGEGGMVVTNNSEFAEQANKFKDLYFDRERRYMHELVGYNYRMTNIQAAIGLAQLERIDELIEIRRRNARLYDMSLQDIDGITLPVEKKWAKNVYWMYTIMVEGGYGMARDALKTGLLKRCIDTRFTFTPMHAQPCFSKLGLSGKDSDFPVAASLSTKGLNLPSGPGLKESQISYICETIKELAG